MAGGGLGSIQEDFVLPCVRDLKNVVDMDVIRGAHLRLGVDLLAEHHCLTGRRSIPFTGWTSSLQIQ